MVCFPPVKHVPSMRTQITVLLSTCRMGKTSVIPAFGPAKMAERRSSSVHEQCESSRKPCGNILVTMEKTQKSHAHFWEDVSIRWAIYLVRHPWPFYLVRHPWPSVNRTATEQRKEIGAKSNQWSKTREFKDLVVYRARNKHSRDVFLVFLSLLDACLEILVNSSSSHQNLLPKIKIFIPWTLSNNSRTQTQQKSSAKISGASVLLSRISSHRPPRTAFYKECSPLSRS